MALLFFGMMNVVFLNGRLDYFMPQISAATEHDLFSDWNRPISTWLDGATWLAIPLIAVVCNVLIASYLVLRRTGSAFEATSIDNSYLLTSMPAIAASVVFVGLQLFSNIAVFQYPDYTSFGIPLFILGLSVPITMATSRLSTRSVTVLAIATPIILLLPFMSDTLRILEPCTPRCSISTGLSLWMILLVILLYIMALKRHIILVLAVVFLFASINVQSADTNVLPIPEDQTARAIYLKTYEANKAIAPYNTKNQLRYWFDNNDQNARVFKSLAAMHLWYYRLVSIDFPNFTNPQTGKAQTPPVGSTIAILSSSERSVLDARLRFESAGIEMSTLAAEKIPSAEGAFWITIARLFPAGLTSELPLALEQLTPVGNGRISGSIERPRIRVAPKAWAYAATLDIGAQLSAYPLQSSGYIAVKVKIAGGNVGFGLLRRDETSFTAREFRPDSGGAEDIVYLRVEDTQDVSKMVIQAWDRAVSAEVEILAVAFWAGSPP